MLMFRSTTGNIWALAQDNVTREDLAGVQHSPAADCWRGGGGSGSGSVSPPPPPQPRHDQPDRLPRGALHEATEAHDPPPCGGQPRVGSRQPQCQDKWENSSKNNRVLPFNLSDIISR